MSLADQDMASQLMNINQRLEALERASSVHQRITDAQREARRQNAAKATAARMAKRIGQTSARDE